MIKKLDNILDRIAFYAIVSSIFLMLGLTVLNIVLRWFNTSILWIDPFVRHLVFLSAFLGGVLATGQGNHIRVDIASKIFENLGKPKLKIWVERLVTLITIIATVLLTKAGYDFAKIELEFGKEAFMGIHSGFLAGIIPVGMGMIGLRFIFQLLLSFNHQVGGENE